MSVVNFQESLIFNKTKKHEEINDTLQILPDPKKFKETHLKYILEVFGPKSDEMSIIGTARFRGNYLTKLYFIYFFLKYFCHLDCKSATNCYITNDEDFFGLDNFDKFDAVVIKPGHLRADKVCQIQI